MSDELTEPVEEEVKDEFVDQADDLDSDEIAFAGSAT